MNRHDIELWIRTITKDQPHLLGTALSELDTAEQKQGDPEYERQIAELAREYAGVLMASLRLISWNHFRTNDADNRQPV